MASLPSFPTAENGYDPSVVDVFVVRLVEKARSEMADLRRYVSELEAALERVAVEQWDPEPFTPLDDDFVAHAPTGVDADGAEPTEPDDVTEDPQPEDEADRIAALVDRRIRGRRLSAVSRQDD